MAHYPCNAGKKQWGGPWGGLFVPEGPLVTIDDDNALGAIKDSFKKTVSGRIIVGFNVGGTPRWTINDLVPIVREVRARQTATEESPGGDPSASFLMQHGIYQHSSPEHRGLVVEEHGAQVIVINLSGASLREFEAQIVELGEEIARRFQQETVIVDIQVNGVIRVTHVVGP